MNIVFVNESKFSVRQKNLQKFCQQLTQSLQQRRVRNKSLLNLSEITCVFLSATEMQIVNKNFRKKNKPTDVLSFAPMDTQSIGELVFCPEVLVRQARQQKHSLSMELKYMMIHGFLHLLGYDHELSKKEENIMFKLQDEIFQELTAGADYLIVSR